MKSKVKENTTPLGDTAVDDGLPPALHLLTVEEAAKALRVKPITVRRLVHRKELRAVRVGTSLRIGVHDLEEYLEQSVVEAPDPRRDSRRGRDKARSEPKPSPGRRRARSKRKSVP